MKKVSKRPMLSSLLVNSTSKSTSKSNSKSNSTKNRLIDDETCDIKSGECWQSRPTNDIQDVNERLTELGFKIHKYFGLYKLEGSSCKFILATSSQGHEVIIEVDDLPCDSQQNVIIMEATESQLLPLFNL